MRWAATCGLLVGRPLVPGAPDPEQIAERERAFVLDFARRLSRFVPDSELTVFNRDQRHVVPASRLLRAAVTAGMWAAERSGGLVDPTLVRELERSGYADLLDGTEPASLRGRCSASMAAWSCTTMALSKPSVRAIGGSSLPRPS